MATLDIGKRCTYTTCNNVDFLPISCNLCSQIFCRQHSLPDDHDCAETKTAASSRDEQSSNVTSLRATCAVLSCSNTVLGSFSNSDDNMEGGKALCPGCGRAYCALHRHAEFHACQPASIDNPTLRNPEAHALLQKHFGVPGAKTALSSKSKPKPIKNKQVLLMKMRQRAIPADASDKNGRYSLQDCILVRTAKPGSDTEQVFWFKKTVGTGRALDLLARRLGVSITDSQRVVMRRVKEDVSEDLKNDRLLAEQIEDGDEIQLWIV